MNISKRIIAISASVGVILGVIALIPPLIFYDLVLLFSISSVVAVIYSKENLLDLTSYKSTALLGGILGFISFMAFVATFVPCVLVISFLFKTYYNYGLPYLINFQAFWLFLIIVVFVAIISASTNAVSLMGLHLLYSLRKGK